MNVAIEEKEQIYCGYFELITSEKNVLSNSEQQCLFLFLPTQPKTSIWLRPSKRLKIGSCQ